MAVSRKLAELFYEVRARTSGFDADLKSAEKSAEKLGAFIKAHPVAAAGALGTALIGVAYQAKQMAAEVERGMRGVRQTVAGTAEEYRGLRNEIRQMSLEGPHSQAELAKTAAEIGRQGVKSVDELRNRLEAATRLADATGAGMATIVGGMDQVLDLFGDKVGSADEAMAKLWETARGRAPVEEVFAALQGAAPAIQDLSLDFDTATKALVALMDKGLTAKKAGAELAEYGKQGAAGAAAIRELAESTKIAADAREQYNKAVREGRESEEASWKTIKNNLNVALIDLGGVILDKVKNQFQGLVGILAMFNGQLDRIGANSALATLTTLGANADGIQGPAKARLVQAAQALAGRASDGKLNLSGMSSDELKHMQNGLAEVLRTSSESTAKMYDALRRQIHDAIAGAQQLAEAQRAAASAGIPTAAQLAAQAEQAKKFKDQMDELKEAVQKAGDAVTKSFEDIREKAGARADDLYQEIVVKPFTNAIDDVKTKAAAAIAAANQSLDPARMLRIPDIERARDATIAALEAVMQAEKALRQLADETIGSGAPTVATVQALHAAKLSLETQLNRLRGQGLGESREAKQLEQQLLELEQKRVALLDTIGKASDAPVKPLQKTREALEENVEAAVRLGRAFISAASALGMIGDEAAGALNDVLNLAEGVGSLIASKGTSATGWAQTITATASLAQRAFGGESAAEKAARLKVMNDNTRAITALTDKIGLLGTNATGNQFRRAADMLFGTPSGSRGFFWDLTGAPDRAKIQGLDDATWDFLRSIAKELGITLDGTAGSIRQFADALTAAVGKLGEFGTSFAEQQRQAEAYIKIFGVQDPLTQFSIRALGAQNSANSPILNSILEGLDFNDPAARAELRKRVQDLFKTMMAGGEQLTAEQLGGLTGDQLLAILEQLVDGLNAIDGAVPKTATALETLADALNDIDQAAEILGTSGADVLRQKVEAFTAVFPQLEGVLDGLDLSNAADLDTLRDRLRELFKSFQSGAFTLPDGTSLDDLASAILTLLGAAGTAAQGIQSAASAIAAAVSQLQSDFEVFDTPLPDQAGALAGAYGIDLSGFDLSTPEGVAAAIKHLQDAYTAAAGDKEAQASIREVIRALRRIPAPVAEAAAAGGGSTVSVRAAGTAASAGSIQNITITQADRIVGLLGTIAINTHELAIIRAALAGTRQPNLTPPALPSTFTVGAGGQVIQVRVSITQHFYGPVNDVGAVGRDTSDEILRRINAGLGGAVALAKLGRGDISR